MKIHFGEFYLLRSTRDNARKGWYLAGGGWASPFLVPDRDQAVIVPGRMLIEATYDWKACGFEAIRLRWDE